MKIRTSLLVACMIVVPALALFSHRVPDELRARVRSCLWQLLASWTDCREETSRAVPADPAGESPATVARSAPSQQSPSVASSFDSGIEPLTRLGAVAVDCRPLDRVSGTHVASCRVAVDAAGQLHRVFQSAGSSPEEALAALTMIVREWQERLVSRAATVGAPAAAVLH